MYIYSHFMVPPIPLRLWRRTFHCDRVSWDQCPFNITPISSHIIFATFTGEPSGTAGFLNTVSPRFLSDAEDQAIYGAMQGNGDQGDAAEGERGIMFCCVEIAVVDEWREPHQSVCERICWWILVSKELFKMTSEISNRQAMPQNSKMTN